MANEFLRRTPTSSGNKTTWTWSGWLKLTDVSTANNVIFGSFFGGSSRYSLCRFTNQKLQFFSGEFTTGSTTTNNTWIDSNRLFRDVSGWCHVMVTFNSTSTISAYDRIKLYFNGIDVPYTETSNLLPSLDSKIYINSLNPQFVGAWGEMADTANQSYEGEMTDVFLVDGQALTPDVFGFYKDGHGYQSSGSTQATDFRPGQWVPKSPSIIKNVINNNGGFGVNGFYLPMNDSSNNGADFHCDPNSIITLKGEDLPQPRNGAPTTTDAYVSQLRPETGTLGFDGVVKFDGSGDYLDVAENNNDFDFDGDFSIEFFTNFYKIANIQDILGSGNNSAYLGASKSGWIASYYTLGATGNQFRLGYQSNNSWVFEFGFDFDAEPDRWYHVAFTRSGSDIKCFVDGVQRGSTQSSSTTLTSTENTIRIGGGGGSTNALLNGHLSNVRVVKGTAVYTGNFTPPTEPLTNITNTKLLCCNSTSSATASTVTSGSITANGDVVSGKNEKVSSLVLAVPGISTATGATLITNGTFDTNTTGWTLASATGTLVAANGELEIQRVSTNGTHCYQQITTEAGKRYTVSFDTRSSSGSQITKFQVGTTINGSELMSRIDTSSTTMVHQTASFTATGTTAYVTLGSNYTANSFWNNIVVKQEDAPRDYSADIRGSGSNKAVQASLGRGGVGYELGGYYGSSINAVDNNCGHAFSGADGAFICAGDFTVELWLDPVATQPQGNPRILGQTNNSGGKWDIYIDQTTSTNRIYIMGGSVALTGGNGSGYGNFVPGQWNHFCLERSGSIMTTYMNGVAVYSQTYTNTIGTTDFLYLGSYGDQVAAPGFGITGKIQDFRFYKGVAKYKGGFDVPKPYTPVGIESWRTVVDTCKNNFSTLNPLIGAGLAAGDNVPVLKDGNLYYDNANQSWVISSTGVSSGKYYAEFMLTGGSFGSNIGVCGDNRHGRNNQQYHAARGISYIRLSSTAVKKNYNDTSTTEEVDAAFSYESGAIVGVTIDFDNKEIKYYKNGTLIRTDSTPASYTPVDSAFYFLAFRTNDGASPLGSNWADVIANFGQNPSFSGHTNAGTNADGSGKGLFKYAPPTGFLALCEDNLPTPTIADPGDYMKTVLYSGDNSAGRRINVGFQPDFIWFKSRSTAVSHVLVDSVRGFGHLNSNGSNAESTSGTLYLSGYADNGFDLNDGANSGGNTTGRTYAAWCWKAGGAAVSNTDGSIASQVSVNQDAGFSIVTYTSTGSNTATETVGHGLNKTPNMIILKNRSAAVNWRVYHSGINDAGKNSVTLNSTEAAYVFWPSVGSDTFGLANSTTTGQAAGTGNQDIVAYCWAEIEGFSKFGSYVGNASADGPFVYCGFKPAWIMVKISSSSNSWVIYDSSRNSTNMVDNRLRANLSNAEDVHNGVDFLSNGFKFRDSGSSSTNASSGTYIFAAFAESPFKTANAK